MVDYLKVFNSIKENRAMSSTINKLAYDEKMEKCFVVIDKALKCSMISMKALADMLEEIGTEIESNSKYSVKQQLQAHMLLMDILNQFQDTILKIDGDAIKKSWDFEWYLMRNKVFWL